MSLINLPYGNNTFEKSEKRGRSPFSILSGNITLFGAKRVVLVSYGLTNPIPDEVVGEEFLRGLFHNFFSYLPIDLDEPLKLYS